MTPRNETRRRRERFGRWAEHLAAAYLMAKGYRILARRYRAPVGEVDLIARRGGVVAFVEVKARTSAADGLAALGERQQRRIARGAEYFIAANPQFVDKELRFDLIVVPRTIRLIHLKGAWRP